MVCESSEFDVSFSGIAGWIKRAVINRMGVALPSGIPHKQLFDNLGFKGQVKVTGSVGIFHKGKRTTTIPNTPLRYLYVGRLVDVKNVKLLIQEFNHNGAKKTSKAEYHFHGVYRKRITRKCLQIPRCIRAGIISRNMGPRG